MELKAVLAAVDHTMLSVTATWEDVKALCDDAIAYGVASVCIPPCYVKQAAEYLNGKLPVCTVIGFPNGYTTTAAKCFEAAEAVKNGADEIDMVINIGWLKGKRYDLILEEIKAVKAACKGKLLKVIIEACLLDEQEKIKMCQIISEAGADFIKTSTGFSEGGATEEDVVLFTKHVKPPVKIKAAGGISSISDAQDFLKLGANRIGTSRIVKIVKSQTNND